LIWNLSPSRITVACCGAGVGVDTAKHDVDREN
jgi:hypothetical protein